MDGAIILPGALRTSPASADARVWQRSLGGVNALTRQTRILRRAGAAKIFIVGTAAYASGIEAAARDRLAVPGCETLLVEPTAEGDHLRTIASSLGASGEPLLLLRAEWTFEARAVERIAATPPTAGTWELVSTPDAATGLAIAAPDAVAPALATLAAIDPIEPGPPGHPAATPPTHVRRRPLPARDLVGILTPERADALEEALWDRCRKPTDGLVSRFLNRRVSLFLSRRLAGVAVNPNHVSVVTFLLGIGGAFLASRGAYWPVLIGAALFKLNSILDGVDGELARMRIQASVLGEWLDTISDDISNQTFFAGIGWGAYAMTGDPLWIWLGLAAVAPLTLTSTIYYTWLIGIGRGDILAFHWFQRPTEPPDPAAPRRLVDRISDVLTMVFRRDAFVALVFVAAIFGGIEYTLFIMAPAGWITFGGLLWKVISGEARRTPEAGASPNR